MKKKITLTKDQIEIIENYITNKGIKYIDLKFEVLDHISSDVENEINKDNTSFNVAFERVKLKWKKSFTFESSALISIFHYRPLIFINRCLKINNPYFKKTMMIVILSTFIFNFIQKNFVNNLEIINVVITYGVIMTSIVYTWFVLYWYFKIKKTKLKTSYSFLFKTQILPGLIVLTFFFTNFEKESFFEFSSFKNLILILNILSIYLGYVFYNNHKISVSNYKNYNLK